ncbi:MAG: ABC transporter permease [Pyrinomonadaceae bacterium]
MRKFFAVVKNEYRKTVLRWSFWIGTLLFPLIGVLFAVVPALLFSIKGEPTRLVIIDRSAVISQRIEKNLSPEQLKINADEALEKSKTGMKTGGSSSPENEFSQFEQSIIFEKFDIQGKSDQEIKSELESKVANGTLDAYLVVPENLDKPDADFMLYTRKSSDFVLNSTIRDAVNKAVRSQRLADADISEVEVRALSEEVGFETFKLDKKGSIDKNDTGFWAGFVVSFLIYLTLQIYGQMVLASVVEEKETKVSEILFSSAKPFQLMFGKLVGAASAGLTQLAVWIFSLLIFIAFGVQYVSAAGIDIKFPDISAMTVIYLFVYFLLGFFLYASIYALIGSMVSTVQEGGQFALIPVLLMLLGFYFSFVVIRDPNSTVAVWGSIVPFVAPITMPVRIVTETPPLWQIAVSIVVNVAAIVALVWLAARVYRIGMLMYGKRATIPEVIKWIRQP